MPLLRRSALAAAVAAMLASPCSAAAPEKELPDDVQTAIDREICVLKSTLIFQAPEPDRRPVGKVKKGDAVGYWQYASFEIDYFAFRVDEEHLFKRKGTDKVSGAECGEQVPRPPEKSNKSADGLNGIEWKVFVYAKPLIYRTLLRPDTKKPIPTSVPTNDKPLDAAKDVCWVDWEDARPYEGPRWLLILRNGALERPPILVTSSLIGEAPTKAEVSEISNRPNCWRP